MAEPLAGFTENLPHGKALAYTLLAGAGIGLLLLLRRKPAPTMAVPDAPVQAALPQLGQLQADAGLQQQELSAQTLLQLLSLPGARKSCYSEEQWRNLNAGQRGAINKQVTNGKLLMTPSGGGVCLTDTTIGLQGHQPIVTYDSSSNTGLFSSGASYTSSGPAGSVNPAPAVQAGTPGLVSLFGAIAPLLQLFAGPAGLGAAGYPSGFPSGIGRTWGLPQARNQYQYAPYTPYFSEINGQAGGLHDLPTGGLFPGPYFA